MKLSEKKRYAANLKGTPLYRADRRTEKDDTDAVFILRSTQVYI